MAGLNQEDLNSRLRLDYRVVSRMQSPLMKVGAYRNVDDLRKRGNPILSENEGHLAMHYLVDYNIKTLVARGVYSDRTSVHIDLLANNNYPFSEPACYVVDSKMPWSPHFLKGRPICLGELWGLSQGAMLLGQLLVHIAKLLNFDEAARGGGYVGYNGEAIEYWKNVLGYQPITKNLPYPQLPLDLLYATQSTPEPRKVFVRKSVGGAVTTPPRLIVPKTGSGFRKKSIGKIPG